MTVVTGATPDQGTGGLPSWLSWPVTTTYGAPTAGNPGKPHIGVDFAAPLGTPVEAGGVGRVIKSWFDPEGGNQVQVKYAQGGYGWFAHLNEPGAKVGADVSPSTIIGNVGQSGNATGPHLHFQLLDRAGQNMDVTIPGLFTKFAGGSTSAPGSALDAIPNAAGDLAKNLTPQINVDVPGFAGVGDFFKNLGNAFRAQNLWRAAFVVVGVGAVFIGGRLYLANPEAQRVREAAPNG